MQLKLGRQNPASLGIKKYLMKNMFAMQEKEKKEWTLLASKALQKHCTLTVKSIHV